MASSNRNSNTSGAFRDKIANLYYKHGLFCASHPYSVILLTLVIASFCCYPLRYQPILGNSSQRFTSPFASPQTDKFDSEDVQSRAPRWFQAAPFAYIQQIFIKTSVSPWQDDLVLTDSFRAPLAEVFRIVESVNNFQFLDGSKGLVSLSQLCLQVDETLQKSVKDYLPQYGCLMVSPAAIWNNNINKFQEDSNLLKSIFERHGKLTDPTGFREILFGVPWKESGIKKFLVRTRQRVLTYSVTIIYSSLRVNYTLALKDHLLEKFPSSQPVTKEKLWDENSVTHIYFEDNYTMAEFIPLGVTYIILCLYIYFSVRKIDLVKYKWALAISAVFTVMMSLLMSVGLCVWFGLNPNLNGSLSFSEILPYLVVVIGLENMLVLTKSVVSTPVNLDVKIRVAQGLSKEGLSITKNLFAELALLAVSFFTFVPAIQEFCLFAVVGLLSDFFLQMVFFITVLSIDIRRLEVEECKHTLKKTSSNVGNLNETGHEDHEMEGSGATGPVLRRTRLALTRMRAPVVPYNNTPYSTSVFATPTTPILAKIPKRLRFFHFWARTRMVQRGLMFCLVVWIMILVYNSGLVEHFTENATAIAPDISQQVKPFFHSFLSVNNTQDLRNGIMSTFGFKKDESGVPTSSFSEHKLQHHNLNLWQSLPPNHWTNLFGFYNISLLGRYITMLPPIHLSIPVSPTNAIQMRHPSEMDPSLTAYFKTYIDKLQDDESEDISSTQTPPALLFNHPSSTGEIVLAIGLALPTFILFIYFMVILYRCICPKHYAEWRSSWKRKNIANNNNILNSEMDPDTYLIMETLPIKLIGHNQEIEAIVSDENIVCSVCLSGDIRIWDAMSGECLSVIDRSKSRVQYDRTREQNYSSENIYIPKTNITSDPSSGFHWSHVGEIEQSFPPMGGRSHGTSDSGMSSPTTGGGGSSEHPTFAGMHPSRNYRGHRRSRSENFSVSYPFKEENINESPFEYQPVWCMNCKGPWLILGCADGRVELWDSVTGTLLTAYTQSKIGVTSLHLDKNRLYVARVNGVVEFLVIDVCEFSPDEEIRLELGYKQSSSGRPQIGWLNSLRAHSNPITVLTVNGNQLITGSQDHLIKVFNCDSGTLLYTIHGHSGPLSALHMDQSNPSCAASGCQEGMICVWDLVTGTCVYNIRAHEGPVLNLMTTSTYLISLGSNDCVCIWEKNQGHLIHTIRQPNLCNDIALLTNNILVTANQNRLVLWDTNFGEALRVVNLGMEDHLNIRHLRLIGRAIVCCYGNELCVLHFPAMTEKGD